MRAAQSYSISGAARLLRNNVISSVREGSLRLGIVELPWRAFGKLRRAVSQAKANYPFVQFDPRSIESYRQFHRAILDLGDNETFSVALFLQPIIGVDSKPLSAEEQALLAQYKGDNMPYRIPFYEQARRTLTGLREKTRADGHCISDLSYSFVGTSEPVYVDTGHLLPRGNEIVAAHMLDELISCGLLR